MMRRIFFSPILLPPQGPLDRPTLHLPIVTCFLIQSALRIQIRVNLPVLQVGNVTFCNHQP